MTSRQCHFDVYSAKQKGEQNGPLEWSEEVEAKLQRFRNEVIIKHILEVDEKDKVSVLIGWMTES